MKELFNDEKGKLNVGKVNEILKLSANILKIAYLFVIVIVAYLLTMVLKEWGILKFLLTLLKILTPFFIGIVIAWLLEPVVRYMNGKGINRVLGTTLVYVILVACIYLFFNTAIPLLLDQINEFIQALPNILNSVIKWFDDLFRGLHSTEFINFNAIKGDAIRSIEALMSNLTTSLPTTFINIVRGAVATFGVFTLGLMIGFYLLFDFDNAGNIIFNIVPKKYRNDVRSLFIEMNTALFGFVKGTLFTAGLVFVLSTIVFTISGLKAPILFGLICGITNIIPYIGPYLGAAPALIVGFSQSAGVGILIAILLLIVQTIEGNFIHPLVMSRTMKLHPVTIMISLLIFEYFFGVLGLIIATPVVAVLKVLYKFFEKKYKVYKERKSESEGREV